MAGRIPFVEGDALHFPHPGRSEVRPAAYKAPIALGSEAWFAWLTTTSFAFRSPGNRFTASKEGRGQGGAYWYAYRRQNGGRRKAYLGRAEDLTRERLLEISKRLDEPCQARHRLVAQLRRPAAAGPPGGGERLVGRRRELTALRRRLDAGLDGQGGLVLIGGEAGIGKTALAEALAREAAAAGAVVLAGRCYDLSVTPPYGPWTDVLRALPGSDASALGSLLDEGAGQHPASQEARFEAVLAALGDAARRRPQLLILDDIHWADLVSLDLLRFLSRQLAELPILLLVTYRADEVDQAHPLASLLPLLVREAQPLRLDLAQLSDASVRRLVGGRYALAQADEDRLVNYLQVRAEGNPFFIHELLRALAQERVLRPAGDRWWLDDLAGLQLPPLLRQVIGRRLGQLAPPVQEALAIAAVIGQEVPLGLRATVAGLDELVLRAAREAAVAARLLVETADGAAVRFAHALVRQALYEGLLPGHGPARRRVWHGRVAEALAAAPGSDPDAVADHFGQAADPRAADWLLAAGLRAERALAWQAAGDRIEAALPLVDAAGAAPRQRALLRYRLALLREHGGVPTALELLAEASRLATEAGDRHLTAWAELHRGYLDCTLDRIESGMARMEAAAATLRLPPDLEPAKWDGQLEGLLMRASDHDPRGLAAGWLALVGRLRDAAALGARWATLGEAAQVGSTDPPEAGRPAGLYLAYTLAYTGRPEAARREFARLRAIFRQTGNQFWAALMAVDELRWVALPYAADDPVGRQRLADEIDAELRLASGIYDLLPGRWLRLPLLVLEGAWDEARPLAEMACASGGGAQHLALPLLGRLAYEQGDVERAGALVRQQLPAGPATPPGMSFFMSSQAVQRLAAALALDRGDLPMAQAWLEAHERWLDWSEATLGRAEGHLGWAHYHRAAGDAAAAEGCARQALATANDPRQPLAQLAAQRALGELATDAGRLGEAAAHLDQALSLATACAAPFERALTLLAGAELALARRQPAVARGRLNEVRAIGTRLGARRLLALAAALADRCAGSENGRPERPAGLSPREVEVLRLIVMGATNAQIASSLHLSLSTVKHHVAHILAKTGAENRAAATAFALRQGLS